MIIVDITMKYKTYLKIKNNHSSKLICPIASCYNTMKRGSVQSVEFKAFCAK